MWILSQVHDAYEVFCLAFETQEMAEQSVQMTHSESEVVKLRQSWYAVFKKGTSECRAMYTIRFSAVRKAAEVI